MHKKKPCRAGLRPTGNISLEKHRVGGTEICCLLETKQQDLRSYQLKSKYNHLYNSAGIVVVFIS